jgi:hypothetical protein
MVEIRFRVKMRYSPEKLRVTLALYRDRCKLASDTPCLVNILLENFPLYCGFGSDFCRVDRRESGLLL